MSTVTYRYEKTHSYKKKGVKYVVKESVIDGEKGLSFHFLTKAEHIKKYTATVKKFVSGFLAIATFSEKGPTKCSGLDITQYSEETLSLTFKYGFDKVSCALEDHQTPFNTTQNFLFCSFKKQRS